MSDPLTAARDTYVASNGQRILSLTPRPRQEAINRTAGANRETSGEAGGKRAPTGGRDLTNRRVEASISSRMNSDATARSRRQPCASRVSR